MACFYLQLCWHTAKIKEEEAEKLLNFMESFFKFLWGCCVMKEGKMGAVNMRSHLKAKRCHQESITIWFLSERWFSVPFCVETLLFYRIYLLKAEWAQTETWPDKYWQGSVRLQQWLEGGWSKWSVGWKLWLEMLMKRQKRQCRGGLGITKCLSDGSRGKWKCSGKYIFFFKTVEDGVWAGWPGAVGLWLHASLSRNVCSSAHLTLSLLLFLCFSPQVKWIIWF